MTALTSINGILRAGRSTLTLATHIYVGVCDSIGRCVDHVVAVGIIGDIVFA
jgi:hypothetical protein